MATTLFTLVLWILLCSIFLGSSSVYYLYMKNKASEPWNLDFKEGYMPSVSILIPVHNEEKTIGLKLENLCKVAYPAEKIETILVNDASTDKSLDKINDFVSHSHGLDIKVLDRIEWEGKTSCLNFALKHAKGDVIIVSDADCFWPADILTRALPYLSSSSVGAVAGRESLMNLPSSLTVRGELFYDKTIQSIRVGESKVHSTIIFQGGFSAFKKSLLDTFDKEADDSGTAFNIVQKNSRTLLAPDIYFYTTFPTNWRNKVILKIRRANQLQRIWGKCLNLLLRRELVLPKRIALPEIILHIFNPIVFIALILTTAFVIVEQPLSSLIFLLVLLSAVLVSKSRAAVIEVIQNNLILFLAMITSSKKRKSGLWRTTQESRLLLDEETLRQRQLI